MTAFQPIIIHPTVGWKKRNLFLHLCVVCAEVWERTRDVCYLMREKEPHLFLRLAFHLFAHLPMG